MDLLDKITIDNQNYIIIIIVIIITLIVNPLLRFLINKGFNVASKKIKVDPTRYKFLKNTVSLVVWLIAFGIITLMIPKLKSFAYALFAGAGIFMAILGFAAQQAFSNIISGIFIVIFRPFRVGDMVKVGDLDYGIVEDITLRHTVINSFQNKKIIIPNSTVSSETIVNDNIDDTRICRWIEFGISYDSDVELAMKIIREEAAVHSSCIDARSDDEMQNGVPKVIVRVISYGDFSVNLRGYVWTSDPINAIQMHSDLNLSIKKRFDIEKIEIPYPYRTIVYKKDI